MSHNLIEQNLSIVAAALLMLESAKIDTVRQLPSEYGVWEVALKGSTSTIQRLPTLMVSGQDIAQFPQLAPLSVMALAIHNNKITFNGDVIYEFVDFSFDLVLEEFKAEHGSYYNSLVEMLDYLAELTTWVRKDLSAVNMNQYANTVLAYLSTGNETQYPELAQLHRLTIASIYINNRREDCIPTNALELLNKFPLYRLSEGQFHTPSGVISKQVVDIIAKTVFLTK